MFQSKVLFEANTYNSGVREGNTRSTEVKPFNSTLFPEGEGVTATCLGQCPSKGSIIITSSQRIIHRVPSVEEITATCLGNLFVSDGCKEINRENAPNELSNCNNNKTKRINHGA
ncbi:MAG: hypothetical protein HRT90_03885 [Candidatus Margulisbacteria bacterium]|nr:hypothetical protein [Candidatus Margulisiibacteriota bacterium]